MDKKQEGRREMFNNLVGLEIINISSLEEKEMRVFDTRFIQQKSLDETSERLGMKRGDVRKIQIKAIGKLKT